MITNKIPILEYDSTSPEVIAPNHDAADLKLPEKCLFAFLGDVVHQYAKERQAKVVKELITVSHKIKVYVLHEEDEDICLVQSLIGALAACCRKRGAKFGQFLFTADSLANVHDYYYQRQVRGKQKPLTCFSFAER